MGTFNLPEKLSIAPRFTVKNWKSLSLNVEKPDHPDWQKAIKAFKDRIEDRFLIAADELLVLGKSSKSKNQRFGFAILAIDFLVIEALQAFREGVVDHRRESERLVVAFLETWNAFTTCVPADAKKGQFAKLVYKHYRCALYHYASTDGDFRVAVSGKTFEFGSDSSARINRTKFHLALKDEFQGYLAALVSQQNNQLRKNFIKKMDAICGIK